MTKDLEQFLAKLEALPRHIDTYDGIMLEDDTGSWVNVKHLDALIAEARGECPACGGAGFGTFGGDEYPSPCPACKGTGRKP